MKQTFSSAIFFAVFSFLIPCKLFSQKNRLPDFIVWEKGDTTYCNITSIERDAGKIISIRFLSSDHQAVELRDNFEVSKAKFINVNNEFFWESVPFRAKKPALKRHLEIEENGKIKVYGNLQLILRTQDNGEKVIANPTAKVGGINRTIKFDNGKYFDVNKRSIKNEIYPYFLNCPGFKEGFREKITAKNIVDAVRVYNKVCGKPNENRE